MSGYPMISPHSKNKEVIEKKIWYPMRYTVTTVSYRLYYTQQVIYIIYTSNYLRSFRITYYIPSAYLATMSYHTSVCFVFYRSVQACICNMKYTYQFITDRYLVIALHIILPVIKGNLLSLTTWCNFNKWSPGISCCKYTVFMKIKNVHT